jgi:hypothetical protein
MQWSILKTEVTRVRDHPAIFAFYIADEPGGAKIAPSVLEKVYSFVKALDPHHPMTMAFCCCDPLLYKNAYDIGMMDPSVLRPTIASQPASAFHEGLFQALCVFQLKVFSGDPDTQ